MAPWLHVPGLGEPVAAYTLVAAISSLAAVVVGPAWIRRLGRFDDEPLQWIVAVFLVIGLGGARALFVATHPALFTSRPMAALVFWGGGRHVAGAIAALAVSAPFVLARAGVPAGRFADAGTPVVGLTIAISRIGCFLHGCCIGTPSDAPWAVRYPAISGAYALHRSLGLVPAGAEQSAAVHPLPLYFAAAAVAIALATAWLVPRKRHDWQVVLAGVALMGTTTAVLERFRMPLGTAGPTPQAAAALALAAIGWCGLALGAVFDRYAPARALRSPARP